MRVRRILAILITALGLFSCARQELHVALLYYNGEDPYIRTFVRQIVEHADGHFALESYDARNSQILQNEQIDAVLKDDPDLVIVNPVDRLGSYTIIRRLQESDVPVIFFNREPLRQDLFLWDRTWYIGARAEQSARLQAELVMDLFGGDPTHLNDHDTNGDNAIQAIILKGEQGHQDAEIRTSEVVRSFADHGFVLDVLAVEVANWDRSQAFSRMDELLREHGEDLELVISNNDAMALGAISRMRQNGYFSEADRGESWLPVVGIDGIDDAVEQIEDGYLYGTVKNDSLSMAEAIVELARIILDGRDPSELSFPIVDEKYIWIDYQPFVIE